jgi:hypothetical protein
MNPYLERALTQLYRRQTRNLLLLAAGLFVFAIAVVVFAVADAPSYEPWYEPAWATALPATAIIGAFVFAGYALFRDTTAVLTLFRERATDVVDVTRGSLTYRINGIETATHGRLHIILRDGSQHIIQPSADELDELERLIRIQINASTSARA